MFKFSTSFIIRNFIEKLLSESINVLWKQVVATIVSCPWFRIYFCKNPCCPLSVYPSLSTRSIFTKMYPNNLVHLCVIDFTYCSGEDPGFELRFSNDSIQTTKAYWMRSSKLYTCRWCFLSLCNKEDIKQFVDWN